MLCYGILNLQETKYGVHLNEMILSTNMKHGFKVMCDVHEATKVLLCFLIHAIMNILLYKFIYTYYTLFLCLWEEEGAVESQIQADQQNIMLNN